MLSVREGEKILLSLHRHWIVVASKMTVVAVLLLGALLALIVLQTISLNPMLAPLVFYGLSVYLLLVFLIAFVLWMDYYLDVWIVTSERIIDVEQKGMFRREASEFPLSSIQDVTVEVPGFLATLMRYGTIRVQTAGNQNFVAHNIPNVDVVKTIIMNEVQKSRIHVRSF